MSLAEVLIVGVEHSGLSVFYHLHRWNVDDVYLLKANHRAVGSANWYPGTKGPELPGHTKMVLTPDDRGYASLSHTLIGRKNARKYLDLKANGVWLQRNIAEGFGQDLVRNLGTVVLAFDDEKDRNKLTEEHKLYLDLEADSTLDEFDEATIVQTFGTSPKRFTQGLSIKEDFILDIDRYVDALGRNIPSECWIPGTMTAFKELKDRVIVDYSPPGKHNKTEHIETKHLVIATNGFWTDDSLKGLLTPMWTYVLCFKDEGPNTPNACYFSKNGHYFTRQDNVLIIGGQDIPVYNGDFSKPHKEQESLDALLEWTCATFPHLKNQKPLAHHYGVFAETIDNLPIVGNFEGSQRVFYIVGCNGDGQSALSFSASLMPAIMGYRDLQSKDEKGYIDLISANRPSLKRKI